ncbi:MAG TPA: PHP domain-containing protein, partial [Candidatus Binatia bacterium]|nr:PHP domain-containing protein [Candidatus Binatia bacterium]
MTGYAALWCKSSFSFLEGASHPDEYVETAALLGLGAVALTDHDGVYGVVHAHRRAQELGVRLLVGSEISVDDGSQIVLLATDRRGYASLCRLVTRGRLRSEKGRSAVSWDEVCAHSDGVIALWGGERSALVGVVEPLHVAASLKDAFGDRLYAMAARHRRAEEIEEEARLRRRAAHFDIPVAAAVEVLYHSPSRRPLQDVLTCIRHGTRLTTVGRLTRPNAEHALKPPRTFVDLFEDDFAAVSRTSEIAERCTFTLSELRYRYPSERLPDGKTSAEWLRGLTLAGARGRYGERLPADVTRQIEKELALIDELDYCGYFLTMHEIVEYCRRSG